MGYFQNSYLNSQVSLKKLKPPPFIDIVLLSTTLILMGIGITMVYSTTGVLSQEKFGDSLYFVKRQLLAAMLGVALMYGVSRIHKEVYERYSHLGYLLGLVLLILPLIPGIAHKAGGASRWVSIFGFHFQPGEISKLFFVIYLAGYFARHDISSFKEGVFKPFILLCPFAGLYLLQPDFGNASGLAIITLVMAAAGGVKLKYIFGWGVFTMLCAGFLVFVSPYRAKRLLGFLSPWADSEGQGYQLIQSLIAIGSGEISGVGIGSSQQKLFFLPAAHTDFIFSVVAEEMGFIGAVLLLAGFVIFFLRGISLAKRVIENAFSFHLAVGCTLLIAVPAFLNIGVVTGLLPTKGLVLPFVGYGGSSLVAHLMCVGVLLSVAKEAHSERR